MGIMQASVKKSIDVDEGLATLSKTKINYALL